MQRLFSGLTGCYAVVPWGWTLLAAPPTDYSHSLIDDAWNWEEHEEEVVARVICYCLSWPDCQD